jgi:hypothetical protein
MNKNDCTRSEWPSPIQIAGGVLAGLALVSLAPTWLWIVGITSEPSAGRIAGGMVCFVVFGMSAAAALADL